MNETKLINYNIDPETLYKYMRVISLLLEDDMEEFDELEVEPNGSIEQKEGTDK